jgi:hypothetical protein
MGKEPKVGFFLAAGFLYPDRVGGLKLLLNHMRGIYGSGIREFKALCLKGQAHTA